MKAIDAVALPDLLLTLLITPPVTTNTMLLLGGAAGIACGDDGFQQRCEMKPPGAANDFLPSP